MPGIEWCPRCHMRGMETGRDQYGPYRRCFQCGHEEQLHKIANPNQKPVDAHLPVARRESA